MLPEEHWQLFDTNWGTAGIRWRAHAITGLCLPDAPAADIQQQLHNSTGGRPPTRTAPPWLRAAQRLIQQHLRGTPQDFSGVSVDCRHATPFMQTVYAHARRIPAGQVTTYTGLADAIGRPNASRAVGTALGKNPIPLIIPCHRIVAAHHKPGGFTSPGGLNTKRRLLAVEGVALERPQTVTSTAHWQRGTTALLNDPLFAALHQRVGTLPRPQYSAAEPLSAFVDAIVSQQLSTRAAHSILQRVRACIHQRGQPSARQILATPDATLRQAGLSGMKVEYLKDLAKHTLEGSLPSHAEALMLPDETLIHRFTAVKGVGRWTVEMYLIFGLGRSDIFPADDYGIRKAIMQLFGLSQLPAAKTALAYGERWAPYRTVATHYLWRSLNNSADQKS